MAKFGAKYTKSFFQNLDSDTKIQRITSNVRKTTIVAGENANKGAPIDTGALRKSKRIQSISKQGVIGFANVWQVYGRMPKKPRSRKKGAIYPRDYAHKRYVINKKNPQTRFWAKKDLKKNRNKYDKLMIEGVME